MTTKASGDDLSKEAAPPSNTLLDPAGASSLPVDGFDWWAVPDMDSDNFWVSFNLPIGLPTEGNTATAELTGVVPAESLKDSA